jgi:exonuclease III
MLGAFLHTHDIDIAFLQEVTTSMDLHAYHYSTHLNIGTAGRGTAFITRAGFELSGITKSPSGRIIMASFNDLQLVNIYAPSSTAKRTEREAFYNEELPGFLHHAQQELLLGGDFNCVLEGADATRGPNFSRALAILVQGYALKDIWQSSGSRTAYTHFTAQGAARLDRFYASAGLYGRKRRAESLPAAFTDHLAVLVAMREAVRYGYRPWKFNGAILPYSHLLN